MGKSRRKKSSSTLTAKAVRGFFRLVAQGIVKASPLFFFGLIGFGIFWGIRQELYADPGFLIEHVRVTPPEALTSEQIQDLEKTYLGQNLFKVSLRKVANDLEKNPRIQRARVVREFPRTLSLEITQRNPFVQIQLHPKGPYYAAGEDGVVLEIELERNPHLLLLEAPEAGRVKPERGKKLDLSGFHDGIELARAFWAHPLGRSEAIQGLRLDHLGGVTVVLKKGPELRFGRQPMRKFQILDATVPLLKGPERNQIVYIELQYQDLIVRKK